MAHLNLMNLHQDRFQDIQEFRDQYIALKKVCADGARFSVHKEDGSTHVFKPSKKGLFFSDVKSDVVLINTVDSIKNKYTVKDYSNACKAWSIQDMIG